MTETRTVHDPFIGKDVQVSDRLVDRLRGKYAQGPTMPNGEPEFGWRHFPTSPIQQEAASEIERLNVEILNYGLTLAEARKVLKPFASRAGYGKGRIAEAATAAATFLNKIGWGK
jgi:hypothetical protein